MTLIIFFFQAEDGIRDLVRSRGLGDVYKRQTVGSSAKTSSPTSADNIKSNICLLGLVTVSLIISVSYTHLTLPTSDLV